MDNKKKKHKPVDSFKDLIGSKNDAFLEKEDSKSAKSSNFDPWIDSSSSADTVNSEWFTDDGPIDARPKYVFEVKPITEPKYDFEVKPIAESKYDFEVKRITESKYDFEVKPIRSIEPKFDFEVKPIISAGPKCDFEAKPIESLEPKCDFARENEKNKPVWTPNVLKTYKGAGLLNLGNTCFLNVVLQCFLHTVPLFDLLMHTHVVPCDLVAGFCLICAFKELIGFSLAYEAYDGCSVSPWRLVENLSYFSSGFHKYQQEDAHEFLQCFLNRLERRCSDIVFGGRLVSKVSIQEYYHIIHMYLPLIEVSLEIKDTDNLHLALESFTRVEKLDDPEIKYTCERCKVQVSIEKQLMLYDPPSVAIIHLKRFQNDGSVVGKVDKHVSFPLELDLLPYTDNNQTNNEQMKYYLYAVIVHAGSTSSSGHYYCFICAEPNEWYKFDDSTISWVHEDLVLAEKAYIMFYAKRDTLWFSDFVALEVINSSYFHELKKIKHSMVSDVSESNVAADETVQASNPGPTSAINSSDSHELNKIVDKELKENLQRLTPGSPCDLRWIYAP
ncbi:hypothetical protein CQW23_18678, partial [Capsicum baccatum]